MAVNRFTGGQALQAQVDSFTITADDAATTFKVTCDGKVISVLGSGVSAAATAAILQAALAASTTPAEYQESLWTVNAATITRTGVTAGMPLLAAVTSVSGGAGTIGAVSTTTVNKSPSDVNDPINWSLGAAPVSTDDIVFEACAVDVLWNLAALAAVVPNSITKSSTFTGRIGLPQYNPAGYNEARATYLQFLGVTAGCKIGEGGGPDSPRTKIDFLSGAAAVTVYQSGQAGGDQPGLEAVLLKGTNAGNVLEVYGGSVGYAVLAGETGNLSGGVIIGGNGQLRIGSGVTLAAVTQYAGNLETNGAATTVTILGGEANLKAGNQTTLTLEGGATYYQGGGTIATLNLYAAILDATKDGSGRTVTNANFYGGLTINDPGKTIAWTNPIVRKAPLSEMKLNFGPTGTLLPA